MTRRPLAQRVVQVHRWLRGAAFAGAAVRAIATSLTLLLAAVLLDALVALSRDVRLAALAGAIAAGIVIFVRRARASGALSPAGPGAALWIESRFPVLRYALVTALDPAYAGRVPALERQAAAAPFEREVLRVAGRALALPALGAALLAALVLVLPAGAVERVVWPRAGDSVKRPSFGAVANPLAHIAVRIEAPSYSRRATVALDDPSTVSALAGSEIVVSGDLSREIVRARAGNVDVPTRAVGSQWEAVVPMLLAAGVVRFSAGSHSRLLALDPVADSVPAVTLTFPARDSIYRQPRGVVQLSVQATDDIGLANARFEFVVSSGAGETFTYRSGTVGAATFNAARTTLAATVTATLSLDSLGLRPGDILHLRAVARDGNNVSGPGIGTSETRALRIARADEYDSLAVEAFAPPEPEKNALSQRMLLMLTSALERRHTGMGRSALVAESRTIAVDQARLRKRVGDLVFARLGEGGGEQGDAADRRTHKPVNADSLLAAAERAAAGASGAALEGNADETPLFAVNRPLLEAYNHMWNAGTELELGQPARAIPWMQKALDALQTARAAERIYLRGRPRPVVVDVERVRLTGKDRALPAARTPRPPLDPARLVLLARFDRAVLLARRDPGTAADSLLMLRIEGSTGGPSGGPLAQSAQPDDATIIAALGAAASALRAGGNVTTALVRARRVLGGPSAQRSALTTWSTPW